MRDVADRCGFSLPTVCQILGQRADRYRAQTVERVLSAAQELGYRVNNAARATAKGKFNTVALLMSTQGSMSYLPAKLWSTIHDALATRGIHLLIARLPDQQLTDKRLVPRVLHEWCVDGLLINYTHRIPAAMLTLIGRHNVPSVWLSCRRRNSAVYLDDIDASARLTTELLGRGHRRVAYLQFSERLDAFRQAHHSVRDRPQGYCRTMRAAGLKPELFGDRAMLRSGLREETSTLIQKWLSRRQRPSAVIVYGDADAYALLLAAQSLGLRVPQDLAVAAFGQEPLDLCGVRLPTMLYGHQRMGQRAVDMLCDRLEGRLVRQRSMAVPCELAHGDCFGPPR